MGTISWEDFEKVELRVITFRIGDLGFGIVNTKTKFENSLRIPQSAFPNPQSMSSSTPKQLATCTNKAIYQ
jgi:hypothetical protein